MQNANETEKEEISSVEPKVLEPYITLFDLKRLDSYSKNLVDFHLVLDLVPAMAKLHAGVLPAGAYNLSPVQAALLTGVGFQHKSVDQVASELNLQVNQLLPMFNKAIKKFTNLVRASFENEISLQIAKEEKEAKARAQAVMQAAMGSARHDLDSDEDEALTKQLKEEKTQFLQKHALSMKQQQ